MVGARRGRRSEDPPRAAGPKAKGMVPGVSRVGRVRPLQREGVGSTRREVGCREAADKQGGTARARFRGGSRPCGGVEEAPAGGGSRSSSREEEGYPWLSRR